MITRYFDVPRRKSLSRPTSCGLYWYGTPIEKVTPDVYWNEVRPGVVGRMEAFMAGKLSPMWDMKRYWQYERALDRLDVVFWQTRKEKKNPT